MNYEIICYLTCVLEWIFKYRLQSKQIFLRTFSNLISTLYIGFAKVGPSKTKWNSLLIMGTKILAFKEEFICQGSLWKCGTKGTYLLWYTLKGM